jgi:hypothetical protein
MNMVPLDAQIIAAGGYLIDVRYGTDESEKTFRFTQYKP